MAEVEQKSHRRQARHVRQGDPGEDVDSGAHMATAHEFDAEYDRERRERYRTPDNKLPTAAQTAQRVLMRVVLMGHGVRFIYAQL